MAFSRNLCVRLRVFLCGVRQVPPQKLLFSFDIEETNAFKYYFLLYKAAQAPGVILALFGGFLVLFVAGVIQLVRAYRAQNGVISGA